MASSSQNVEMTQNEFEELIGVGATNDFDFEENDSTLGANKRTRTGKQRSPVWDHMKKILDGVDAKGKPKFKAVCNHCHRQFVYHSTGGLGSMKKYLQNAHQLLLDTPAVGDPMVQTQLGYDAHGNVVTFVYDEPRARRALAHYITATEKPIGMADCVEFDTFVQTAFCPSYRHIGRNTTRNDIIALYSERKAEIMQSFLDSRFTIACTSDMWTGRNNKGYICVTAHYIDRDWILQKRVIAFREVPYPHNGVNMGETIVDVFNEWGISERITSMTFDNASSCDSAVDHMQTLIQTPFHEEIDHVRCVCHIINLIVQDGLKYLFDHVEPIRAAILYIGSSPRRTKRFKDFCASNNKRKKTIWSRL